MKLTQIGWWIQYLKYCKKFKINATKPKYEEYVKTMEQVKNYVNTHGKMED